MLFTCIKISWFFRNHLANFHQILHWSFSWNVIDSLFKWSCSIDCQAHIFFFKTKNCSNDDIFISCDDRIGKMLHNICMSAVAMSIRWANRGPWASCFFFLCSSVLWALRLPRLGKRELILVLFVRLFDLRLFGFVGFLFLTVSRKGCGLWLWHSLDFSLTFFTYGWLLDNRHTAKYKITRNLFFRN